MIYQKNNYFWFKLNGFSRFILNNCLSGVLPLYIINEYPKSGGSWLGQMLSEALGVPFPRNRLPMLRSSIMHGHYIHPGLMKNVVVLWRDGRDVLISQYYHSLFKNEKGNSRAVDINRGRLNFNDYHDIRTNLNDFIKYTYTKKGLLSFSWSDFVHIWARRKDVVHAKYENLRKNPALESQRILKELTNKNFEYGEAQRIAEKYSFEKQSGRSPGQENTCSFMRKGIIGDWKNHFTPEAKRLFDKYAGDALITLGYEKNHAWASE